MNGNDIGDVIDTLASLEMDDTQQYQFAQQQNPDDQIYMNTSADSTTIATIDTTIDTTIATFRHELNQYINAWKTLFETMQETTNEKLASIIKFIYLLLFYIEAQSNTML